MTASSAASPPNPAQPPAAGKPHLVILVHGTGAADPADRGERWWQFGSPFGQALASALSSRASIAPPFHWSGANSERVRQAAAAELATRLAEYEAAGERYHLIGHSHGGSVIWHALVASARHGSRLTGLQSWATVGTPFLSFRAVTPSPWRIAAMALLVYLSFWLMIGDSPADWIPAVLRAQQERSFWMVAAVGLVFGALLLLTVWAVARVVGPLVRMVRSSQLDRAESRARDWYGQQWLALWHPLDEPINALAGTVGPAPEIAPRVAAGSLLNLLPFAGWLFNRMLARATDQFAWSVISDRAQGADLYGYRLVQVSRAPAVMQGAVDSLSTELADQLSASADSRAIDSVHRLRALLETAYDSQGSEVLFDRISSVVSFQEIIHTSYFDHAPIHKLLIDHIALNLQPGGAGNPAMPTIPQNVAVGASRLERSSARIFRRDARRRHFAAPLRSLEAVITAAVFVGPGLLLALAGASAYEAVIGPYTERYQIRQIANVLSDPERTHVDYRPTVGDLMQRLMFLGLVSDPITSLEEIASSGARQYGAPPIAYALGQSGRWTDVDRLAVNQRISGDSIFSSGAQVRAAAVLGAMERKRQIPPGLWGQLQTDFANNWPARAYVDLEKFAQAMAQNSHFERLEQMIGAMNQSPRVQSGNRQYEEYYDKYRCQFWVGAQLGAIVAGYELKTASTSTSCETEKNLYYRKADAWLKLLGNTSAEQIVQKISPEEIARHSYQDLKNDFDAFVSKNSSSLNNNFELTRTLFGDENKQEFTRLGFNLRVHARLEMALTKKSALHEYIALLNAAAAPNVYGPGQFTQRRVKMLVLKLLQILHEDPDLVKVDNTRAALLALYQHFADMMFVPLPYIEDARALEVNPYHEAARLLTVTGRQEEAVKLVSGIYERCVNVPPNTAQHVHVAGYIGVGEAAHHLKLLPLRDEALKASARLLGKDAAFYQSAELGLHLLRTTMSFGNLDAQFMLSTLKDAERSLAMTADIGSRSDMFLELSRNWIRQGDLAHARALADKSTSRTATLTAYAEILDKVIANRIASGAARAQQP